MWSSSCQNAKQIHCNMATMFCLASIVWVVVLQSLVYHIAIGRPNRFFFFPIRKRCNLLKAGVLHNSTFVNLVAIQCPRNRKFNQSQPVAMSIRATRGHVYTPARLRNRWPCVYAHPVAMHIRPQKYGEPPKKTKPKKNQVKITPRQKKNQVKKKPKSKKTDAAPLSWDNDGARDIDCEANLRRLNGRRFKKLYTISTF